MITRKSLNKKSNSKKQVQKTTRERTRELYAEIEAIIEEEEPNIGEYYDSHEDVWFMESIDIASYPPICQLKTSPSFLREASSIIREMDAYFTRQEEQSQLNANYKPFDYVEDDEEDSLLPTKYKSVNNVKTFTPRDNLNQRKSRMQDDSEENSGKGFINIV